MRQGDEGRQRVEVDLEPSRELGAGIGALRLPGPLGPALQIHGDRLVRREEPGLRACLDGHVRDGQALVDGQRLRPGSDELEHRVRGAPDAELGDHGQDQVLTGDERLLLARELDLDRSGHGLPELARRETGGHVGRAEARAEGAERAVGAGMRVAARDHRARHDPALLDEHRVLDAAAALRVVGDALPFGPLGEQLLELGRALVLRGREVVGNDHHPGGIEDLLHAHPLHRPERHRARDVVRHDDVAADHDDLAGEDAIGLRVGEQDLLSERVRQRGPGPGQTTTTG